MDCIHINNIRAYGYIGYFQEEKVLGQWFEVDLTMWLDLVPAGTTDALDKTVDYRNVIATVKELIKESKFDLVERLAAAIAEAILKIDLITQVRVQLKKPNAPIPEFGGNIIIDITRSLT